VDSWSSCSSDISRRGVVVDGRCGCSDRNREEAGLFSLLHGEKGFIVHFGESVSDIKGSEVSHDLKQAIGQTRVDGRLPVLALIALTMNEGIAPGAKNEFDLREAIQDHELTAVRESGKAIDIFPLPKIGVVRCQLALVVDAR
jgi:hypothetical protein